jgi:DNA-binding beta-propeller fold protein YncE
MKSVEWFTRFAAVAALVMAGCSSAPVRKGSLEVFYPPAPQEPKIQYLRSINSSADIESEPSWFEKAIVGTKNTLKGLGKPYGLRIHDGKIYVCDTLFGTIVVIDLEKGKFYLFPAKGRGKLKKPIHVFIDAEGNKYVADIGRGQIVVFDKNDKYVTAIGDKEEMLPTDAVVEGDTIYVADAKDNEIEARDRETGEVLFKWGKGGNEKGQFLKPTNLAVDAEGNIYVTDTINFRVQEFDRTGKLLKVFGKAGDGIGAFTRPKGIALDREGHLYVVDSAFENVQIFDQTGDVLLFFGGGGSEPGSMYLPAHIIIDYDNVDYFRKYAADDFEVEYLILVSNQYGERKINVYGFGHAKKK